MTEKKFQFKDYWSLFKLSCRSYIYQGPSVYVIRPFIAGYVCFASLIGFLNIAALIPNIFTLAIFSFAIFNPYYLKYAVKYKTSDWYTNTGYLPSEVCSDMGLYGEYHATMDMEPYKCKHGKIYNGLIIPKPDGSFTELDLVVISEYYAFVVECKARSGDFSGHILDDTWTQKIGSQTNQLQNPVQQNQNHINFLQLYLAKQRTVYDDDHVEFDNVIYFARPARLYVEGDSPYVTFLTIQKKAEILSTGTETIKLDKVHEIINSLDKLPKYTAEEKARMINEREVQYRNGEFIHKVKYYPIKHPCGETFICMDGGYYKFYLCSDGLWRTMTADPFISHPKEKGTPCSTLQEATLQKKELGW